MTSPARIESIELLECRLGEFDWDFARDRHGAVGAYWSRRTAANPALYDGEVLLANRIERSDAALRINCFRARFSRFLAWRDFGFPDRAIHSFFAMPALRSADGAFLLAEMGPGHSLAGQLFFPGGTPDLNDVRDGEVDLRASLVRELLEETGIAVEPDSLEPSWRVVFERQRAACLKIIDWPLDAREIVEAVARHIASEERPELARAIMVRSREELADPRMPVFVRAFLTEALAA